MKTVLAAAVSAVASLVFLGCASSHQEGVKSDLRTQWTQVAANTTDTTEAAKAVLEDKGLKNVMGQSTNIDGAASGMMADNTKVKVDIKKETATMSEVSVTVGALGSPQYGAEIVKAIKMKAEGMKMDSSMQDDSMKMDSMKSDSMKSGNGM